jgi:hypothetical protein
MVDRISDYDPTVAPPDEIIDVIERGLVEIVRRVEIYESDGVTRWLPGGVDLQRFIEGSVTVDYSSDERRKFDLTLENIDGTLRPNPNGGLWYDKILKPFYGVTYSSADVSSPLAIIECQAGQAYAQQVSRFLSAAGFDTNDVLLGETSLSALRSYTHIVSVMSTNATSQAALLGELYAQGKTIVTVGVGSNAAHLPHYSTYTDATGSPVTWGVSPVTADTPTSGSFVAETASPTAAGWRATATAVGATALAAWPTGAPTSVAAAIIRNGTGGYWIDIRLPNLNGAESRKLLAAALTYAKNVVPIKTWTTQMGEFYIDRISEANFPDSVKITSRDATKKLMNSKLSRTSVFTSGTSLRDFVSGQLSLGGIATSKMKLDIGEETLTSEMSFSAGASRWEMIKSSLESFGYERFFDAFGNFVVRKFLDPSMSPVVHSFGVGADGNLVSFERSVNDSRIYNRVIVTAAPADADANPIGYYGEARVTDANSPTHESRIGDRVLTVDAPWIASDIEAVELANTRLQVTALESYELSFESIYYPWLECGEIVRITDPDALDFEPDRFLLDSISYPLALGPMGGTGKRVTYVGSPGGTG